MIIGLAKSKNVGLQTILVLLISILVVTGLAVRGVSVVVSEDYSPVYLWIAGWMYSLSEWMKVVVMVFIFVLQIGVMARMYHQLGLHQGKAFLPIFISLLILFAFPKGMDIHPVMLASVFFFMSIQQILKCIESSNPAVPLFNSGFFLSLASLIHLDLLLLFPALFVALMVLSIYRWPLWGAVLSGLLLPWIYFIIYWWVFQQSDWLLPSLWWNQYLGNFSEYTLLKTTPVGLYDLLMYGLTTILILVSAVTVYSKLDQTIIFKRYIYKVLLWFFVVVLLLLFTTGGVMYHKLLLLSFFSVFVVSDYLQMVVKRKPVDYFLILILLMYFANHLSSMT